MASSEITTYFIRDMSIKNHIKLLPQNGNIFGDVNVTPWHTKDVTLAYMTAHQANYGNQEIRWEVFPLTPGKAQKLYQEQVPDTSCPF